MAEKIAFNVDLSGLADWAPYEGFGSNSLMKQDGSYKATVTKVQLTKSSNGSPMFLVQQIVQDEDEKGASLLNNVMVGGNDKNGKSMIRQLGDFLQGCGTAPDVIRSLAQKGSIDGEQLASQLVGKTVHFTAEAETYEGKQTSKVKNYISKQQYDDAVAANAHRRPRAAAQSFAGAPAGVVTGPANVGGPAANGAAPKANPLQALASLSLPI